MKILYVLLTAGLLAGFVLETAAGDGWRSAGFAFCVVCLLVVRDDLTRQS